MNVLVISTTFIPSVLLCGHCQLEYLEKQGTLKKIDRYRKEIIFTDNTRIKIDSIVNINVNKL